MKLLKWLFILTFLTLVVAGTAAYFWLKSEFEPFARAQLELRGRELLGPTFRVHQVQLSQLYPPELAIQNMAVTMDSGWNVQVPRVEMTATLIDPPWHCPKCRIALAVAIDQPKIILGAATTTKSGAVTKAKPTTSTSALTRLPPLWISLRLKVNKGHFVLNNTLEQGPFEIKNFDLHVGKANLFDWQNPLDVEAKLLAVLAQPVALAIPLHLKIPELLASDQLVAAKQLELNLGGLIVNGDGASYLQPELKHHWNLRLDIPDFAAMPKPPHLVPGKDWRGRLQAQLQVDMAKELVVAGQLELNQFFVNLDFKNNDVAVQGPTRAEAVLQFNYQRNRLNISDSSVAVNLTEAYVNKAQLLEKPAGVPLELRWKGFYGQQGVSLNPAELKLAQIHAVAGGTYQPAGVSQLSVQVAPTSLEGLEKLFPPLRASPMKGTLAVKANVFGPLYESTKVKLGVESLKVSGLKTMINYQSTDRSLLLSGPLNADVQAQLMTFGSTIQQASLQAAADLSGMKIVKQGTYSKPAGQPLRVQLLGKQKGSSLELKTAKFTMPFAEFNATGTVVNPLEPRLNVKLNIARADLAALGQVLPAFSALEIKGGLSGQVLLNGQTKPSLAWQDWPLNVGGALQINMPTYVVKSASDDKVSEKTKSSSSKEAGSSAAVAESEPFLPSGYLTKNINLSLAANVGLVKNGTLELRGVDYVGKIQSGQLTGGVKIAKIFNGQMQLSQMNVPLLEPLPLIKTNLQFNQIDMTSALQFAAPEFKDWAKGLAHGQMSVSTRMPSAQDFLSQLNISGQCRMEPTEINSLKIDELANEQLSKIPGIKKGSAKVGPMKGKVAMNIRFAEKALQLNDFHAWKDDGSELALKGKMDMDKNLDLQGTLWWKDPPVDGCLKDGNSDASGRMIVPLTVRGQAMNPSFSFAAATVEKLSQGYLNCEKKKLLKKVESKGKEKLQDELKKQLKNVFGQ